MCHLAALCLVAVAIVADSPWLVRIGAAAGALGAIAFLAFFARVMKRMVDANLAAKARAVAA